MEVAVSVVGGDERTIEVDDQTYGDLIEAMGLSVAEATALVDGRPVPADGPVEADAVTVLRLIHGG